MDNVLSDAEFIVQELIAEKSRVEEITAGEVPTSNIADKSFKGSGIERRIYSVLCSTILDPGSVFVQNPQVECLKLALAFLCDESELGTVREAILPKKVADPSASDRELLRKLLEDLYAAQYTESQLFHYERNATETDANLVEVRKMILRLLQGVPMLEAFFGKLQDLFKKANGNVGMQRLKLDMEDIQKNESLLPAIQNLDNQILMLKDAIASTEQNPDSPQVVYMESLTYPMRTSTYVCGNPNCRKRNDASASFFSRIHAASREDYGDALNHLIKGGSGILVDKSMIHDACVFVPTKCECGAINIPSKSFMQLYRLNVISRWDRMTPEADSANAIVTYSIDTMGNIDDDAFWPKVQEQEVEEVKLKEIDYTDIFSNQTYSGYLSSLALQGRVRELADPFTRQANFLAYIISQMNLTTVGYTPTDMVYSVVEEYMPKNFLQSAREYLDVTQKIADGNVVAKVVNNEDFTSTFTEYQDVFLSTDYIKPILERNKGNQAMLNILNGDYSQQTYQQLAQYITELSAQRDALLSGLVQACTSGRMALINDDYQKKGLDQITGRDIEPKVEPSIANNLFVIKPHHAESDEVMNTFVMSLVWEHFKDCYAIALVNTIMSRRDWIYRGPLFRGIFLSSKSTANTILRQIYCAATGKTRYDASIDKQNKDEVLILLLMSCLQAKKIDSLATALNTSKENLLKLKTLEIPELTQVERLINYKALDGTKYPCLSAFADGSGISDFAERLKADLSEEDDVDIQDSYTEAEIAAALYLICTPYSAEAERLRSELDAISRNTSQAYGDASDFA